MLDDPSLKGRNAVSEFVNGFERRIMTGPVRSIRSQNPLTARLITNHPIKENTHAAII